MKSFLILACLVSCAFAVDYCNTKCSWGTHVGCGKRVGELSRSCITGSQKVDFSKGLRNTVVDYHNKNRNILAGGKLTYFKSAARMATMQWDAELAEVASLNVYQCVYGHDECRSTGKFPNSGQNICMEYGSPANGDITPVIEKCLEAWFSEHNVTSMWMIEKLPNDIGKIGHFTVMAAEKNIAVGCAAVRIPSEDYPTFFQALLVCNYATTNWYGEPIYKSNITPASDCKSKSIQYPNLCAVGETYS